MALTFAEPLLDRAHRVLDSARGRGLKIATAESCTGGMIAAVLTEIAGSSDVVERGWVTYSNAAKIAEISVPEALVIAHGAVSQPVACAMAEGALAEVEVLQALNLDPALPVMRAHGVPGLMAALRGAVSFEEAIVKGKADTRHYARRQHTWFRHQLPDFSWISPEKAEAFLQSRLG